jgi:nicotinamide riboside kinase
VGLLGAECTGKSSIAEELSGRLGAVHVPEALRAFVETRGRVPDAADQAGILSDQRAAMELATLDHPDSIIICDPLPLMTAIYGMAYFDDWSLLDTAVDDARTYDLIWWCRPDLPWRADGRQRDGEEYRARVDSLIETTLRDRHLAVTELTGDRETRIREAIDSLRGV